MPISTPEERLGTRLDGKYELLRVCGRGGMSVLFEGVHVWTGRRVAVKVLHAESEYQEERLSRFLREARTAAALRHPNVVDILDMGADAASPFLVMELLSGESLEAVLGRERALSPERTLELLLPVLGAVAVAHDAGIVHRDLKPENIFISRDASRRELPKLLDFGIAEVSGGGAAAEGFVLGTPAYMSPEQAEGGVVGPPSDVWAMGVVLYRCLSGTLPFDGDTSACLLSNIVSTRPRPLSVSAAGLPVRFCAALDKALAADPASRYPDMRAFAKALVVTADASGIALAASPEPLGFPDYAAWRSTVADHTGPLPVALRPAPEASASFRKGMVAAVVALAVVGVFVAARRSAPPTGRLAAPRATESIRSEAPPPILLPTAQDTRMAEVVSPVAAVSSKQIQAADSERRRAKPLPGGPFARRAPARVPPNPPAA